MNPKENKFQKGKFPSAPSQSVGKSINVTC